jgi:hypothetical protein
MSHHHDQYGKAVLKAAFPDEFDSRPLRVHFDETLKDAGTATIDGRIGEDIAVEIESRVSKQVRGALVDLAFHPYRKKLMVLIPAHGNRFTGAQCRVILRRLCPECRFEVVEIKGSGALQKEHFSPDVQTVRTAVQKLRRGLVHTISMITYSNLVQGIAALHTPISKRTPPYAIPKNWIPTAVDSGSFNVPKPLPVVIAFGANYTTGTGKMPNKAAAKTRRSSPWIEENLGTWKKAAKRHIDACKGGKVVVHWNGLLPHDITQPTVAACCARAIQNDFHFVMTNACPWVTYKDWSRIIRDKGFEDVCYLLSRFDHTSRFMSYFCSLRNLAGNGSIWIGHGNADVYGVFRYICWRLKIQNWFFASNLSYPNKMIKRSNHAMQSTASHLDDSH